MSDEAASAGPKPKVFGIGQMKTGTSSLGSCFTALGLNHRPYYPKLIRQLYRKEFDDLWRVADSYDSFEDNPWPLVFTDLDERYPDASFVLTTRRDSETWYGSLASHAKRRGPTAERHIIYGKGWPNWHKRNHIEQYEAHNRAVRDHFADRPDKLLEVCWETGSTWDDVAIFLGMEPPRLEETPAMNVGSAQGISALAWLRNTTKYLLIGLLRIDPWRRRVDA